MRQATDTLWWSLGRLRAWIKDDIQHVYPLLIIFFAVILFHPGGLTKALPRR